MADTAASPIATAKDLLEAIREQKAQEAYEFKDKEFDTALITMMIDWNSSGRGVVHEDYCIKGVYDRDEDETTYHLMEGDAVAYTPEALSLRAEEQERGLKAARSVISRITDIDAIYKELKPAVFKGLKKNLMWWQLYKSAVKREVLSPGMTASIIWSPDDNNFVIEYNPHFFVEGAVMYLINGWPTSALGDMENALPHTTKPETILGAFGTCVLAHECCHALYRHTSKRDGIFEQGSASFGDIQDFGDRQININVFQKVLHGTVNSVMHGMYGNIKDVSGEVPNLREFVGSLKFALEDFIDVSSMTDNIISGVPVAPADVILLLHTAPLATAGVPLLSILSVFNSVLKYSARDFSKAEAEKGRKKVPDKTADGSDAADKFKPGQIVKYVGKTGSWYGVVQEIVSPDKGGPKRVAVVPCKELPENVQEMVKEELRKSKASDPSGEGGYQVMESKS